MAVYTPGSVSDLESIDSIKKVQEYLIKQERKLDYMFNNLDPEENYSELARLTMVTDGQRQATIEATLQGIQLNYVSKDGIVSAINLSEEMIQIEASKIKLEGVVTVNGNFKVGLDGSIEANNGRFTGNITGSTIEGSHIYASYYGSRTANDFFIIAEDGVTVVGVPGFEFKNRKMASEWIGSILNPALNTDQAGINGSTGYAGFRDVYLMDPWMVDGSDGHTWSVVESLKWLDNRITPLVSAVAAYIRDIESGDDDDGDEEGDGSGDGEDYSGGYLEDGLVDDGSNWELD